MNTSNSRPERVNYSFNRFRQQVATVNIDITEAPDGDGFQFDAVPIPPDKMSYAGVADTLISHKYPTDRMQAVQNNLLADPSDPDAVEEFRTMQAWRVEAKAIARGIFPE